MSRIYEALLQAEKDRALAQGQQQQGAELLDEREPAADPHHPAAGTATAILDQLERAPAAAPRENVLGIGPRENEPLTPSIAVPRPLPTRPAAPSTSAPQSLVARKVEWKPIVSNLPALEARGTQVEQFRSLRSKLFEFRDLNKLKVIMVASGRPSEGKSFVASNLAVNLARHRAARVLLIDGDMRRSSLHLQLGTTNEPGLADYLAGKATLAEILQTGTSHDDRPLPAGLATLSFIGAGDGGDKAADLSGNSRFKDLVATLTPHFDWIIVDSSPVNLVTDGINLARHCDAVLLIVRAGVTRYETAQRALAELKASKILGVVLNAVDKVAKIDTYYGYDKQINEAENPSRE